MKLFEISYSKPNFDTEWEEAQRYPEFKRMGKANWIDLANTGTPVEYDTQSVHKINNTDAANVTSFTDLDTNKQGRALAQMERGSVELPIVTKYSDGHLELVAGNTRLTAMMKAHGRGTVWQIDVPDNLFGE